MIARMIVYSSDLPALYEKLGIAFFFVAAATAVFFAGMQWGG
jgi:hypothetical protein